ncbi:transmembrane glucosamine N-acetyltransferase NagX [Ferrimonas balearica]|uniref:transmembrane glucosamine N-acetyltransferase NagX n=1 Tax=Ferrimonas balearica TaxID=44012 RepID=UPI001C99FFEC|nr:DUF5009 domain-containing protein [Ferrimonas balearica]MBY5921831.1 DUF5009 domain-containing protein [Ferrimonas balearica]MBY5994829.1 DUF5009 domain-containing protein [Ferrimonas balearica]
MSTPKSRLQALDALRGFDMFWIIGGEKLFAALLLLTGWPLWQLAANEMLHSNWHGFTFYDLIFPLFIFLSGVTIGLQRQSLAGLPWAERQPHYRKALKRLLLLCVLGVLYNHGWGTGMPMALDEVRYASVLGRIGMAWFLAAMIAWHLPWRGQLLVGAGVALVYGLAQGLWGTAPYSAEASLNTWVDQHLLPGITYRNAPLDPEGLLSHLSAALNALIGVWAGYWLRQPHSVWRRALVLAGAGALAIGIGWSLHGVIPVNKTLWTLTFVAVTVGWSALFLALFLVLVDGLQWRRMGHLFALIGVNSIFIYLASAWFDWGYTVDSLIGGVISALPEPAQALAAVIGLLALQWAVLAIMARRGIFLKV